MEAKKMIRFVDSAYKTLFELEDSGQVMQTGKDGLKYVFTCKYIDEYHLYYDRDCYHISQLAEILAKIEATVNSVFSIVLANGDRFGRVIMNGKVWEPGFPSPLYVYTEVEQPPVIVSSNEIHHYLETKQIKWPFDLIDDLDLTFNACCLIPALDLANQHKLSGLNGNPGTETTRVKDRETSFSFIRTWTQRSENAGIGCKTLQVYTWEEGKKGITPTYYVIDFLGNVVGKYGVC